MILSRVASETPGRPLTARDTAAGVTPARRAMSAIVTRLPRPLPEGRLDVLLDMAHLLRRRVHDHPVTLTKAL